MKTLIFAIASFMCLTAANAGEKPVYPCYKLTGIPFLDGRTEEAAWINIPSATGFFIIGSGYALKQTSFKAGWTDDALYIALRAEELHSDKIIAKGKDGDPLWDENSIEMFFSLGKGGKYLQFIINSIGGRWNTTGPETSPQPIWDWKVNTFKGTDFWAAEIKIPFKVLGKIPADEEIWAVNIARNILTGPATERYTCWPPLKRSFNEVENFGHFVFKKHKPPADVKNIEKQINSDAYTFLASEVDKSKELFIRRREILQNGLAKDKFRQEAISLKELGAFIKQVAEKRQPTAEELGSASAKSADLRERLVKFEIEILLEELFE